MCVDGIGSRRGAKRYLELAGPEYDTDRKHDSVANTY